ncbi:MAG: glycoside hydrolase family 43 protein [Prevotella sp.]|nr:glycoside hydrolase family 43 protein [Prevotella sp.]
MKKTLLHILAILTLPQVSAAYNHVSIHDPSIVVANGTYYIFGTHHSAASSTDLMNWTDISSSWRWATDNSNYASNEQAFTNQQVKTVNIGGVQKTFNNFNARAWSAYGDSGYSIENNMWAPDVIWNKALKKWCMYLSINGSGTNCSIILLTSDNIAGPYRYQAPVVVSGFYMSGINYHNTDLELAIGTQSTLPSRYQTGNQDGWRQRWPNAIDPCVFYDEQGKLWMTYGSWHGGIWILELDEQTGLRDYNIKYAYTLNNNNANDVRTDPYYGKKIAGGFWVTGEGPYIRHIGNNYYLFITYGELWANGGYQMRVFRSNNPDGPYYDSFNTTPSAIYDGDRNNYGPDGFRNTNRGENIFGAYGDWGYQTVGDWAERAQGHNSVLVNNGQNFMFYHTRFQNRGEDFQMRVHQFFLNQDGWLCAAPFEYSGETVTDQQIASSQTFNDQQVAGGYKLLIHTFNMNHFNKQLTLPINITLNTNGTITGGATGSWHTQSGTSYITLTVNGIEYKGVIVEQTLEPTAEKTICFTAYAKSKGYTVWGYHLPAYQETVGSTDNTSGYLDAVSSPLLLNDGQTAVFEFINHTSKVELYHNWVACFSPGTVIDKNNILVALRADNWENILWSDAGITNNYNWFTFKDDMEGSYVVLTMTYKGGSITIHADITTASGVKYYEEYTKSGVTGSVTAFLTVEKGHLLVSKSYVISPTGIRVDKADSRHAAIRYNLSGQQVGVGYKGIIIENGRKRIVR